MRIDCHVHIAACTEGHGSLSRRLMAGPSFRYMKWKLGLGGPSPETEAVLRDLLLRTLDDTPELDAAVVLAFDAAHFPDGRRDVANTHLYVTNDYVAQLARRHPKVLFGASIHPYRRDALAELERCVRDGATLVKWLPPAQRIDPSDPRCIPFYEAMAHYRLPLLSHTGAENSMPVVDIRLADPALLETPLRRGVTVIAAHCGTRLFPLIETNQLPKFARMVREHENLYGDTAALNVPLRWYAYDTILKDEAVRSRLVHGSDWPVIAVPPPRLGLSAFRRHLNDANALRADARIKRELGLGEDYFARAAGLLRLDSAQQKGRLPL